MKWSGKKVLVTGGLGFLGSFVTERLLTSGAIVTVTTTKQQRPSFAKGAKILVGDLKNPEFASRALRGQEFVFHLAALKVSAPYYREHPAKVLSDNISMHICFFEAAQKAHVKKIIISSSTRAVDPPPMPEGSYGWAKRVEELLSEAYSEEFALSVALVRLPNTFGPRDDFGENGQVVPSIVRRVFSKEDPLRLNGSPSSPMEFIYVEDAVHHLLAAASDKKTFYCTNISGTKTNFRTLVSTILNISENKKELLFLKKEPRRVTNIHNEVSKSFERSLAKTVAWFKDKEAHA